MLQTGAVIDGRYEILGPLGAGGMGQVYRARRVHLGDEVAVKIMLTASSADGATLRERFLRESRALAALRHPHIVTILDFDIETGGRPFLVMELLSGPSLREELELGGPLPPLQAATVLREVGAALQLAHARGITHRDLKPANIVSHRYDGTSRVYKVIDFGLASLKATGDETRLTGAFVFLGTMAYAAPEQLRGETVGPAADVYSLGVVAYEMLTGRRPFEAADPVTLAQQVLSEGPTAPGQRRGGVAELDAVLLRALAKTPAERWPDVASFLAAFEAGLARRAEAVPATGATTATAATTVAGRTEADHLLTRYELGPKLGRGRLGSLVFRGTHRALGVPVAVRVLRRDDQPHWDAVRARFLLEARTLQVAHPHLLQVRDFGEADGAVFVVTDLVEGPSLRQAMAGGPMAWLRVVRLVRQMVDAAAALHERGGYLAGVNPDMVRITGEGDRERVVLSSSGIRGVQDVLATMREQELRGTEASEQELPYMAPEVLMGRAPDARADLFTLAVLGVEMLTGAVPFRAPSMPELIGRMLQAPTLAAPAGVPAMPFAALARALSADPAGRGELAAFAAALTEG